MARKNVDKNIIAIDVSCDDIEPKLIDDFKKLNDKCDIVIIKIKRRKSKSRN